jgi:Glycosyl transferases group 1
LKDLPLHIVSFDIPFPADYGGVMDVFYKIKALHEAGVAVTLHCFQYRDRQAHPELEKYCAKVYYYKRDLSPLSLLHSFGTGKPFITTSRMTGVLLKNLKADNAPILFEGLHTCGYIADSSLKNRLKIVRMHNVEWEYYRNMELLENSLLKRVYFKTESIKLKQFETQILKHANYILPISPDDDEYFKQQYETLNLDENSIRFIPPFHPNTTVDVKTGTGDYVLFHGKLSVSDNEQSAIYLINKVFSKREIPLSIAGKNPSETLKNVASRYENVKIIANPSENEMNELIQNAQLNVLVSFQRSGMKLKLLNALYRGRFCIVNRQMIQNTGLESLCLVKNTSKEIGATVESLMNVQFSQKAVQDRRDIMEKDFSNAENVGKIMEILRG